MEQQHNIADKYKEKSFCVLPWIHLATHPIGTVTPCCVTDMKNGASTAAKDSDDSQHLFLTKDSLDSIANSKKFKQLRKQMLNGERPAICQKCFKYEAGGVESKRLESNKLFEKYIEQCFPNTNTDGSLKEVSYSYVELRLGTVCNLKCTTCNPFSSNRWHQDIGFLKGTEFENSYFRNDIKTEWYRDYGFYDELYKKCKDLQEIWINGGEPTLIKEHGYFLQKFIDDGSCTGIDLHYSLNCTQMPDHFIELWKKFRRVRLQLSIDDLEDRNFYIRYPSDWSVIMESFNKILQYKDIFNLEVCQTVSALNVYNIDKFKKWTLDNDITVSHNYVHYPDHLHVSLIPEDMKNHILSNIEYMREDEIKRLKIELYREHTSKDVDRFHSFIRLMDRGRKVKIYDYLPEFTGLIYDYSCSYPWVHLSNDPSGTVRPCCQYSDNILKEDGSKFYLQKDSISSIFSSTYMKDLRDKFRSGIRPKECSSCWDIEDLGLQSKRQQFNKRLSGSSTINVDLSKEPTYPQEYQLILNNSCNLKCRMCSPQFSSSWQKEFKNYTQEESNKVGRTKVNLPFKQPSSLGSIFMEEIDKWAPYTKSIETLGGEPLYSSAWYKLIDYLIDNNYSQDIELNIVSNGTIYSKTFIDKIVNNFKSIYISLSIDGMDLVFEYLRSNSNWDEVLENIKSYQQHEVFPNFSLHFTYTLSWFNVFQMKDFLTLAKASNKSTSVWFNRVSTPKWMSLPAIPDSLKSKAREYLTSLKAEYRFTVLNLEIDGILNYLDSDSINYLDYIEEINTLDKYRDISTDQIIQYINDRLI